MEDSQQRHHCSRFRGDQGGSNGHAVWQRAPRHSPSSSDGTASSNPLPEKLSLHSRFVLVQTRLGAFMKEETNEDGDGTSLNSC
uniref:Uncharacterized protein n=1 Tax=Leersia perrieri TaxID=77586 RepID=A0A0D9WY25_9ORYZ